MLSVMLLSLALPIGQPNFLANPLLKSMVEQGTMLPGGITVKLPAPLMKPGMSVAEQQQMLEAVLKEKTLGQKLALEDLLQRSDNAPHVYKITPIQDAQGKRIGQRVDLWFVAVGSLSKLEKGEALRDLLGKERGARKEDARGDFLTEKQLQARKIEPLKAEGLEERYAWLDLTILDQFLITGVTRAIKYADAQGLYLSSVLDPRFDQDVEWPNRWQEIDRLANDPKARLKPAKPYSGFASYSSATELKQPAGLLFIEMHVVFYEAPEWYGENDVLRSKLPLAFTKNVPAFRRKLSRD